MRRLLPAVVGFDGLEVFPLVVGHEGRFGGALEVGVRVLEAAGDPVCVDCEEVAGFHKLGVDL